MVDKSFEKCQLLYIAKKWCTCMAVRLGVRLGSKENGVHVWQLGKVLG
jgi:hypothetical protein